MARPAVGLRWPTCLADGDGAVSQYVADNLPAVVIVGTAILLVIVVVCVVGLIKENRD